MNGAELQQATRSGIEAEAQQFFETAPCGYLFTDPEGRLLRVNSTLLEWLGYTHPELVDGQRRLSDLISRGGRIYYDTHFTPLLHYQGQVSEINFNLLRKEGSRLPVLVSAKRHLDEQGVPLFHSVVLAHFAQRKEYETELLRAKKQAESSERAKSYFLSTISHEVLTPLNAIIGMADLLQDTSLNPTQQRLQQVLSRSAQHLLSLFQNVLLVAKSGLGQLEVSNRPFDLRQLASTVTDSFRYGSRSPDVNLQLSIDSELPTALIGDPTLITQLLSNLVGNAIKFTDRGEVRITLEVIDRQGTDYRIEFSVADSGIGIPTHQLAKLFQPFTQASQDIHTRYGGSGLGLAICQSILERFDTQMRVESTEGNGSCFSFVLVLPQADPQTVSPISPPGELPPIGGGRVLLAEDNETNAYLTLRYLRRWEVAYDHVRDGEQAVAAVQRQSYDLVLMDLQMPVMDGYTAARAIRQLPGEVGRLPIVAFSASASTELSERMREVKIDDFVLKPFRPRHLYAKLTHYIASQSPPVLPTSPPATFPLIREVFEDEVDALQGFSDVLQRELRQIAAELDPALAQGDADRAGDLKHKLKTSLRLLDADQLTANLTQAVQQLRSGTPVAPSLRQSIIDELHRYAGELERTRW